MTVETVTIRARTLTMDDIIARLEKATGPDRELDGDISEAIGFSPVDYRRGEPRWASMYWFQLSDRVDPWPCPPYTASIDAALTLVPEGADWNVGANPPSADIAHRAERWMTDECFSATPAIALCIAALKARTLALNIQKREGAK